MKKLPLKQIENIATKIAQRFDPIKIILFGSYAWGKPGPNSDVDLFIITETENTRKSAREVDGFLFDRDFPVDLIVYTPQGVKKSMMKGDFFVINVLKKGRVLYER